MRTGTFAAVAVLSTLAIGCGGGNGSRLQHPALDQDYTGHFAGIWDGSATVLIAGQTRTATGSQRIDRAGFNRLSVAQVCTGVDGAAGVDSATTFSMDPVTCAPVSQSCGPVTIRYESGIGNLAQDTLTMTLNGTASGCGQSLGFTVTFTGRLLGGPDGGAYLQSETRQDSIQILLLIGLESKAHPSEPILQSEGLVDRDPPEKP